MKIVNSYPTSTPRVFHVETTWKRPFPRRFNVEYTWSICRVSLHTFCFQSDLSKDALLSLEEKLWNSKKILSINVACGCLPIDKVFKNGQAALNIEKRPAESTYADFFDVSINLEK